MLKALLTLHPWTVVSLLSASPHGLQWSLRTVSVKLYMLVYHVIAMCKCSLLVSVTAAQWRDECFLPVNCPSHRRKSSLSLNTHPLWSLISLTTQELPHTYRNMSYWSWTAPRGCCGFASSIFTIFHNQGLTVKLVQSAAKNKYAAHSKTNMNTHGVATHFYISLNTCRNHYKRLSEANHVFTNCV